VANIRRKFNAIHSIGVDGVCFNDISSVKGAIVNFYNELYHEDYPRRPFLGGLSYDFISHDDACDLLKEFSEEEVWKAISDLGKERKLRPLISQYPFLPTLLENCQGGCYGFIFGVAPHRHF